MSDTVSFAEFDGQHVELLPTRTVLSMFSAPEGGGLGDLGTALKGLGLGDLLGSAPSGNEGAAGPSK